MSASWENSAVAVGLSSVQSFSCVWLLATHRLQHTRPPCPSPTPGVYSNSCLLSWWCHTTISSSIVPFSQLQSFPVSGSFPVSQLFTSGSQNTGALASASVLPMNIQDWFPLGLAGLISLLSNGLWRVFSNTTVWKHQFFIAEPCLWSNPHICTWLLWFFSLFYIIWVILSVLILSISWTFFFLPWLYHVYLWQIHFDIWQNQYNIVQFKNKIKFKKFVCVAYKALCQLL